MFEGKIAGREGWRDRRDRKSRMSRTTRKTGEAWG